MSASHKHFKVCLLGATFATNNMGVGALTAGAIKAILHQHPDAEIVFLDYGKERVIYDFQCGHRTIPVQLLNMRFSKKVHVKNHIAVLLLLALILKLIPFQRIRDKLISRNFYLRHIAESNIVASIAGGDSFSDIYGLQRFIYVTLPQLLVLLMGKQLFLLPQTLGPFKRRLAQAIAKYILNHTSITYSRDYDGLNEMKSLLAGKNGATRLRFCYDVGFVVDPIAPAKINLGDFCTSKKESAGVVGVNISGLLFMGGYTRNNMFGLNVDYQELVYEVLDRIMRKPATLVLLVPHVFGSSDHAQSDAVVCEKIYNELKTQYPQRLFLVEGRYNQNEIKHLIGLCDFFIGSRMHACIAALSQSIPAVAIAYSRKFAGVLQTLGVASLVADPRTMGKDEILNLIDEAYARRELLREQLQQKIPQVKATVLQLFADIKN